MNTGELLVENIAKGLGLPPDQWKEFLHGGGDLDRTEVWRALSQEVEQLSTALLGEICASGKSCFEEGVSMAAVKVDRQRLFNRNLTGRTQLENFATIVAAGIIIQGDEMEPAATG